MRACKHLVALGAGAVALSIFVSAARAEFVPVSRNLSSDIRDAAADFKSTFNPTPSLVSFDGGEQANSIPMESAGNYSATGPLSPKDLTSTAPGKRIQIPDLLRIRTVGHGDYTGAAAPFSLTEDGIGFATPARDLGWSGHGYEYHAFSSQYERLSALEAVTLVPTPTALQSGIGGLLAVMGITSYIRRRARMRARQRTG